jgi:hypothetical protein
MLPSQFELQVVQSNPGIGAHYAGPQHLAGAVTTDDIIALEQQVSAVMDATNVAVQGCAQMQQSDVTAWNGIYQEWQTWDGNLKPCIAYSGPSVSPPDLSCMMNFGWNWTSAQTQLNKYASQANAYQLRIKSACPSYQPTPTPVPNPSGGGGQSSSWLCKTFGWNCTTAPAGGGTDWSTTIKWVAVFGIIAVAAWYIGPLIATVAGVGAGAIRKRATGSEEFEPVSPRY